jgi:hypothetical protein
MLVNLLPNTPDAAFVYIPDLKVSKRWPGGGFREDASLVKLHVNSG